MAVIHQSRLLDLLQWRATSRSFFIVVHTILSKRYRAHVKPFVLDVFRLDEILRATGAIISGSVALHFFLDDEDWEPGDMDIYVADHHYDAFIELAMGQDGLGFQPQPRYPSTADSTEEPSTPEVPFAPEELWIPSGVGMRGIKQVERFRTPTGRLVDVVRSPTGSPLSPLRAFWSTLVVNFLTPDGCGCGFPSGTLRKRGFVKSGFLTVRDQVAIDKYRNRGFVTLYDPWVEELDADEHSPFTAFGDVDVTIIYFRPQAEAPYPSLPVYHTSDGCWIKAVYPALSVCSRPDMFVNCAHSHCLHSPLGPDIGFIFRLSCQAIIDVRVTFPLHPIELSITGVVRKRSAPRLDPFLRSIPSPGFSSASSGIGICSCGCTSTSPFSYLPFASNLHVVRHIAWVRYTLKLVLVTGCLVSI